MNRLLLAALLGVASSAACAQDAWKITANDIEPSDYYGITVANGQLGLLSSPDPLRTKRAILGGLYDIYGRGRVNNFVHAVKMLDIDIKIDGTRIKRDNISDYTQTLDMASASFTGSFAYSDCAEIKYEYMALRHLPFNCMMTVTVQAEKDISLQVENILSADESLVDAREYFTTVKNPPYTYFIATTTAYTPTRHLETGSSAVIIPDRSHPAPEIRHLSNRGTGEHSQEFSIDLKKGQSYTFSVIGTCISENTHDDVRNDAERLSLFAAVEGPRRLKERHLQEWARLWESDIEIEGDPQAQQDVRSMLYHVYSFVREGSGLSLSPMGLSGFGYNGHVFWDTETWVYPALLLLHPEMARSLLDYRFDRLDAARRNAYQHGYRGAMFPWESAATGSEETPAHNLYSHFEVHINADIALAAWQYYNVTGDAEWLRQKGWPLISATADFWVSRVEPRRDGSDGYELVNVIGADEWGVNPGGGKNVDNNAYTTASAINNLDIAAKAAKALGIKPDPKWKLVKDGLRLTRDDNGIIRLHDTYSGEKTKQADVALLAYPLGLLTDRDDIKRNMEYYIATVPRKATPAMSKSVYSIIYSMLDEPDKALHYFRDSYLPNLNPPFRVVAEFDGGTNPYFITGAGGTLQSVLMGFGGLRISDDGIKATSAKVPAEWSGLTFKGIGPDKKTYKMK